MALGASSCLRSSGAARPLPSRSSSSGSRRQRGFALIGVGLGWVGVVVFPQLLARIGLGPSLLVLAGGLAYTAGAVIYALRRPDPFPTVFGYHELFHACVIVAVACQYAAVAFYVLPKH
jgi:hemolysin III